MAKAGQTLDPSVYGSCAKFAIHVRNVQAVIIHTYQMISLMAIREQDPSKAANMWKGMESLCDMALQKLKQLKDIYPNCGTLELYDLTLDYKNACYKRYTENLQDSECLKTPLPAGLFPKMS